MKKVLSLLVAFVFLQTQSWALSGGPIYGAGSAGTSLTGVYAGVLIPNGDAAINIANGQGGGTANIGLFSLGVPEAGLATGACVVFIDGDAFSGTITGVADPGRGTLVAIVDTSSNFTLYDPLFPLVPFKLFATGQLQATIFANGARTATGIPIPGSTRITGTATLGVTGGTLAANTVTYAVDGYQQSTTTTTAVAPTGLGGIGGGTTGP